MSTRRDELEAKVSPEDNGGVCNVFLGTIEEYKELLRLRQEEKDA